MDLLKIGIDKTLNDFDAYMAIVRKAGKAPGGWTPCSIGGVAPIIIPKSKKKTNKIDKKEEIIPEDAPSKLIALVRSLYDKDKLITVNTIDDLLNNYSEKEIKKIKIVLSNEKGKFKNITNDVASVKSVLERLNENELPNSVFFSNNGYILYPLSLNDELSLYSSKELSKEENSLIKKFMAVLSSGEEPLILAWK